MQNITYGPGTLFLRTNNGEEVRFDVNDAMFEYEESTDAIDTTYFKLLSGGEATLELNNVKIYRRLWWELTMGKPWQWPVSNNWLKAHGYDMRRCRIFRKL